MKKILLSILLGIGLLQGYGQQGTFSRLDVFQSLRIPRYQTLAAANPQAHQGGSLIYVTQGAECGVYLRNILNAAWIRIGACDSTQLEGIKDISYRPGALFDTLFYIKMDNSVRDWYIIEKPVNTCENKFLEQPGVFNDSLLYLSVTSPSYTIGCNLYYANGQVVLQPAHEVLPRCDLIVVDTNYNVVVITGVASLAPAVPTYDPLSQLPVTSICLLPGQLEIACDWMKVYDENIGQPTEWAWARVDTISTGAAFPTAGGGLFGTTNATSNPYVGTKHISFNPNDSLVTRVLFQGTTSNPAPYFDWTAMRFSLQPLGFPIGWNGDVRISLYQDNILIVNRSLRPFVNFYDTTYQDVIISPPTMKIPGVTGVNKITITGTFFAGQSVNIDNWEFQGCLPQPKVEFCGIDSISYRPGIFSDTLYYVDCKGLVVDWYLVNKPINSECESGFKVKPSVFNDSLFYVTVSAASYYINCIGYSAGPEQVELDPSDPDFPRIDLIVVDTNGAVVVITGVPGVSPIAPTYDPLSQLPVSYVFVPAGATTLACTPITIYNENTAPDWTWTVTNAANAVVNLSNTADPFVGAVHGSIISNNPNSPTVSINGVAATPIAYADWDVFKIHIKLTQNFNSGVLFTVNLMNGNIIVASKAVSAGLHFQGNNTSNYQVIQFSKSDFNIVNNQSINRILIRTTNATRPRFYFDFIQFQGCLAQPEPTEDKHFANANLIATGNRTHDWAGYNYIQRNINQYDVSVLRPNSPTYLNGLYGDNLGMIAYAQGADTLSEVYVKPDGIYLSHTSVVSPPFSANVGMALVRDSAYLFNSFNTTLPGTPYNKVGNDLTKYNVMVHDKTTGGIALIPVDSLQSGGGGTVDTAVVYLEQLTDSSFRAVKNTGQADTVILRTGVEGGGGVEAGNGLTLRSDSVILGGTLYENTTITGGVYPLNMTFNAITGVGLNLTSTSTAAASSAQTLLNIQLSGVNVNSGQTTAGVFVSNSHTGATSTNYGGRFFASGGTTNYGINGDGTTAGVRGISSAGIGVSGISTTGTGGTFTSSSGIGLSVTSTSTLPLQVITNPSSTNTVVTGISIDRATSGTAANDIGVSLDMNIENTSLALATAGRFTSKWLDANSGSLLSEVSLIARDNSTLYTVLQITGTGIFTLTRGLTDYADDTAAGAGGIPLNGLYRTGSIIKIRVL